MDAWLGANEGPCRVTSCIKSESSLRSKDNKGFYGLILDKITEEKANNIILRVS